MVVDYERWSVTLAGIDVFRDLNQEWWNDSLGDKTLGFSWNEVILL